MDHSKKTPRQKELRIWSLNTVHYGASLEYFGSIILLMQSYGKRFLTLSTHKHKIYFNKRRNRRNVKKESSAPCISAVSRINFSTTFHLHDKLLFYVSTFARSLTLFFFKFLDVQMHARKALVEVTLDYDNGGANSKHDPRKGKPGNGGKNP